MIYEAHATGVFGEHRRGLAEAAGVEDHVDVTLGTLSKALGCAGGYVAGSQTLIDFLRNRARSLIYSTALPPSIVAAAAAAVDLVAGAEGRQRCARLWRNVAAFGAASPIIPVVIGDEAAAMKKSQELYKAGIFVPAIRYPTVPKGKARLRVTVTAAHEPADVTRFLEVCEQVWKAGCGEDDDPITPQTLKQPVGAASSPRSIHSAALRRGRVSIPEECYFVTTCVRGR